MTAQETDRLRILLETGIAISSELSLDAVLSRIVEAAALVTSAQYAALGVIDATGTTLERFVTHGIDDETRARIGALPRGRGVLGALIADARTLRLNSISDDPRSVGFPPGHPPMKTFLGTPIMLRGVAYGNLYLTEKAGGAEFDQEDEELVTVLSAQAAVAIENARLYESATDWSRQLESMQEISEALVAELDLPKLLQLVVERMRELIDARIVAIALPVADGLRVEAIAGEGAETLLHTVITHDSKVGNVFARGRSERVDSIIDDPEVVQEVARRFGAVTGLYVPLVSSGSAIGIAFAHDRLSRDPRFTSADLRLAEHFTQRAAVAVELSQRVQRDSLRRMFEGQELERRRLARELHDETGQALTSVLLGLKAVETAHDVPAALADLRELVVGTLQDVRRLAVELRPKALDDFGLLPAVERLVETFRASTGIGVQFESQLGEPRLPPDIETTLYRVIQEALTNVAKHAGAQSVSVLLVRRDASATAVVEDDGEGFTSADEAAGGIGLAGMRERLGLLGGRLVIESDPATGTTLAAEVPL
ncbi:MAG TPA: GAF domain-containing sensor histidine kinase [Gaiellaceae bacterium]|nr:GAF domain-containing sensor histidine kinase [Gaiellaceae bacterium]